MYAFNAFAALTVVLGLLANNVAGAALPSPEDYSEYRLCIGGAIKCDFNNGRKYKEMKLKATNLGEMK